MDAFTKETVKLKLDDIFNNSRYFSIHEINELASMLGVNIHSHPDYKVLRALSLVEYSSMSPSMKEELPNKVMSVLSSSFDTELMSKALIAVANGEIKELPPIEDVPVSESVRPRLYSSI